MGDFRGNWYYKTWTGKSIEPKVKICEGGGYWNQGVWKTVNKDLVQGKDYELTLGNNRDMGYCKLYVKGIGDYSGVDISNLAVTSVLQVITEEEFLSAERENLIYGPIFVIRPLGTTLNKVTPQKKAFKVTWKCQAKKMSVKRITGYQIQLSTRKDFETYKLVTVKGYKNTAKTIKKLKSKKKYYVRIRTYYQCKDGFKAYSTWSKAKTVTTK